MIHARTRILAVSVAALAGLLMLAGCRAPSPGLQQARDTIAADLPKPYFEDLVTESATVDGNRLVLLVRSPAGDADKTRASPDFDSLQLSEIREMRGLCTLAAIRPLTGTDAVLVRRFVDRDDALFFEIELPARECSTPPAQAPAQPVRKAS